MRSLLVCSVGPYALRRRPLLVGIPLERVAAARPLESLLPFPGAVPPLLGLTLHEGQIIPVFSAQALLRLPEPAAASCTAETQGEDAAEPDQVSGIEPARHLVLVKGGAGVVGLVVSKAVGIDRPLHWAGPNVLAPLASPVIAGAVLRPDCWIAVLDPARLPAVRPAAA